MSLLEIRDLRIDYRTESGVLRAVDDVSLVVERGDAVGVVGESGCGKSTLGLAIPLLLAPNATVAGGSIRLDGTSIADLDERQLNRLRWTTVSFIFQGAMNALNPVQRIDQQILEAIRIHEPETSTATARARVVELLGLVGIAPSRAASYPHEFSGGMRQRAMIAMALACQPALVIADEPTTALDAISQDQILQLLRDLRRRRGQGLIMISHDLAAITRVCDRIVVMYAGVIVETGTTADVLGRRDAALGTIHPYTRALLDAHPDLHGPRVLAPGLSGHPPDLARPIVGCRFADRCAHATDHCRAVAPALVAVSRDHDVRCHFAVAERVT